MNPLVNRQELDAINDTLIREAACGFLMSRLVGDAETTVQYGNELIFLAIQRQEYRRQWVEIGQRALLDAAGDAQDLIEIAYRTPFFTASDSTLQLLARLSCACVTPPGIYSREEALIKFASGELTLDRRRRRQSS